MSITISAEAMSSDQTNHTARPTDPARPYGAWMVSWLPDVKLDRNQAITAMTLAETVARHELPCESRWWPHIDAWAEELGLTGPDAVVRASDAPDSGIQ